MKEINKKHIDYILSYLKKLVSKKNRYFYLDTRIYNIDLIESLNELGQILYDANTRLNIIYKFEYCKNTERLNDLVQLKKAIDYYEYQSFTTNNWLYSKAHIICLNIKELILSELIYQRTKLTKKYLDEIID